MKDMTRHKNAVHYGMKIKWNSRKNKEKSGRMRGQGRQGGLKREDTEEREYRRSRSSAEVKLEDGSVSIPVEYIETVETSGEEISIGMGGLEGSTVILDPVCILVLSSELLFFVYLRYFNPSLLLFKVALESQGY